ncbi:MAG: ABC-F family ATP-binding cassette domain-containing protein [Campylobacterales bacterium]|nr:ABC-F family ATP-binding cassette domain-containing protein [Campylobacterales bacterium]
MTLVDLQNISKQYDSEKILDSVNLSISEGERVAIVGKNGSGKSTLIKIALGLEEPDEGERNVANGVSIEMLAQAPKFNPELSVREAVEKELSVLTEKKELYEKLSKDLTKDPENSDIANELTLCSNYIEHHGGWNIDDKIERVLVQFDLKSYENRQVVTLSGGEQRRVALAGLLLKKPDLLLLDEPTNHLDVYMVKFLEEMLLREKFTLLFISHDRYFIDRLATKTVEVDDKKIRAFKGGYSNFLLEKQKLLETLEKQYENQLRTLKTEMEWLNRGVKARLKRNEGRKKRAIELKESLKQNPAAIKKIKVQLQREQKSFNRNEEGVNKKKMLFEIEDLNFSLGDKTLVKDFNSRILFHDKIAIVGKNGSGKSSFLKLLLKQYKQTSGKIKSGEFTVGYFDQHRDMLDDSKDIMETFCPHGGDRVEVEGRNIHVFGYLKNWLFPKEFLDKKIGTLSGGEKNRVALAWLFTKKYDCLVVDEPTNDLDIPTINILEQYLNSFQGALIFVSHDRYFVDKISKKLFIFKGQGEIEESVRSYTEYLELEDEINEIGTFEVKEEKPEIKREKKQTKLSYKEKILYEKLPEEIDSLEEEVANLEKCMSDPECYKKDGLSVLNEKYQVAKASLDEKVEIFFELEEKLEAMNG